MCMLVFKNNINMYNVKVIIYIFLLPAFNMILCRLELNYDPRNTDNFIRVITMTTTALIQGPLIMNR